MQNQHLQTKDTEENIKYLIDVAPFKIDVNDKIAQEVGLFYLPYSTGFEVECYLNNEDFDLDDIFPIFKSIPYIIEVDANPYGEQRFRIPKGIKGLVCLFHISDTLKKYAFPNPDSGIHYHIDFTECYDDIDDKFIDDNKDYILEELEKWDYKGTYNRKYVRIGYGSYWVRFQETFKTMEIRIGEMTFEYPLLFKRISHANHIAKVIKSNITPTVQLYDKNTQEIINNRKIQI